MNTTEITKTLALAAEDFRDAIKARNAAEAVHNTAKANAKKAGKAYYDARNTLDEMVSA